VSSKATGTGDGRRETMMGFEEEAELGLDLYCRRMKRLRNVLSLFQNKSIGRI
jgi:hypothetical protein